MALPKAVFVKESESEIKKLLKSNKSLFHARLRMLLFIKKSEKALSKNQLADLVHCSATSIQTWRNSYLKEGMCGLLSHSTNAARPSIFTYEEHTQLEAVLKDSENGFQGYKELHNWVTKHIKAGINPNSLMVYCRQKFETKIKVARKSHVKKDQEAVDTFKKTLVATLLKP